MRILTVLLFLTFCIKPLLAQEANEDLDELVTDTKNDLMIVVGGGLAGAVLGLSTLSFVEEPKKHTRNIIVGASIGIIAGVGFVAFSQANKTQDLLYGPGGEGVEGEEQVYNAKDFDTYAPVDWNESGSSFKAPFTPYHFSFSTNF